MPRDSATLPGYPELSIWANHSDMCKFDNEKDGNYLRVAGVLERWAKELKEELNVEDKEPVRSYSDRSLAQIDLDTSPQRSRTMQPSEPTAMGSRLEYITQAGQRTLGHGYVILAARESY